MGTEQLGPWLRWLCLGYVLLSTSFTAQLVAHMSSRAVVHQPALALLHFCANCDAPRDQGGFAYALKLHQYFPDFSITAPVVYCLPNSVEGGVILNPHHLRDKIVLVDRGKTGIVEKLLSIQHQTKALAVIIADDGQCDDAFSYCGIRAGSVFTGGFAAHLDAAALSSLTIPSIVISVRSADRLRQLMALRQVHLHRFGLQNVSTDISDEEDEGMEDYGDPYYDADEL